MLKMKFFFVTKGDFDFRFDEIQYTNWRYWSSDN